MVVLTLSRACIVANGKCSVLATRIAFTSTVLLVKGCVLCEARLSLSPLSSVYLIANLHFHLPPALSFHVQCTVQQRTLTVGLVAMGYRMLLLLNVRYYGNSYYEISDPRTQFSRLTDAWWPLFFFVSSAQEMGRKCLFLAKLFKEVYVRLVSDNPTIAYFCRVNCCYVELVLSQT